MTIRLMVEEDPDFAAFVEKIRQRILALPTRYERVA